jgi:hypothetical protein
MGKTIFERLAQPAPKKAQEISPAQRLLDFLQRWPKDTISARNIYQFGPRSTKKRREAMAPIEVLVRHGWLTPIQSHRRDRRQWQIRRRLTVHPTVDG